MKHFFSLGIPDAKTRLVVWGCACAASSVLLFLWWPLGAIPFVLLCLKTIKAAKKAEIL